MTAQNDWAAAAEDGSAADATCKTPGCGKPEHHRGRHANQAIQTKPKPSEQHAAKALNGQLVRVTLTVPLSELLKIATVESASL